MVTNYQYWRKIKKALIFAPDFNGRVAEWLGRALQKLLQRFESVHDLKKKDASSDASFSIFGNFFFYFTTATCFTILSFPSIT